MMSQAAERIEAIEPPTVTSDAGSEPCGSCEPCEPGEACNDLFVDTARLYRDYAASVTRWAGRLAPSRSDAEDITQEVFLVVEKRRSTLPPLRNPASWLFRITSNIVRHRWRDRRRHGISGAQWLDDLADQTPSPLDDLERRRQLERLDVAMGALGPKERRLLWLCDVRRLPTSRISAMTGIKPETLRVRRFRARAQVARRLRELDGPA